MDTLLEKSMKLAAAYMGYMKGKCGITIPEPVVLPMCQNKVLVMWQSGNAFLDLTVKRDSVSFEGREVLDRINGSYSTGLDEPKAYLADWMKSLEIK